MTKFQRMKVQLLEESKLLLMTLTSMKNLMKIRSTLAWPWMVRTPRCEQVQRVRAQRTVGLMSLGPNLRRRMDQAQADPGRWLVTTDEKTSALKRNQSQTMWPMMMTLTTNSESYKVIRINLGKYN